MTTVAAAGADLVEAIEPAGELQLVDAQRRVEKRQKRRAERHQCDEQQEGNGADGTFAPALHTAGARCRRS